MYDKANAPKWLQDCMLSVELKWHKNRSGDRGGGGGGGLKWKIVWGRILVQVTIYRRLLVGRDGHLDQSEAYDIS